MVFLLLAALTFLRPPAVRGLEVTILDTGQGDGICIRTKSEVILVDGGSTDQKELGRYRLEPLILALFALFYFSQEVGSFGSDLVLIFVALAIGGFALFSLRGGVTDEASS